MSTSLGITASKRPKLETLLAKSTTLRGLLPPDTRIVNITPHGTSKWTICFRIDTIFTSIRHRSNGARDDNAEAKHEGGGDSDEEDEERDEGEQEAERRGGRYFVKIAQGENGKSMVRGECESAADMERVMPGFCVKGVGWGVLGEEEEDGEYSDEYGDGDDNDNANEDSKYYFYIQPFTPMRPPTTSDISTLVHRLAIFHTKSEEKFQDLTANQRPRGTYFGYHVPTHNGHLAQDNTWTSTWEEYFTRNMKTMLEYDKKAGGPRSREMEELLSPLFEKVVPRLLRPMEMDGRKVKPSLCHGDLWVGNVGVVESGREGEDGKVVVFDPGCFWGHAEYDLRTLNKEQRDEYLQHVPVTYPEDDFEARIMLYHLRSCLHDCALFPENLENRKRFMEEARVLVDMYPGGLNGGD